MLKIFIICLFISISTAGSTYKSYQDKIICNSESVTQYPKSLDQLQKIVKDAIDKNTNIKVIGSCHSVTDVICTNGIPIHLKYFNETIINEATMTATIGIGLQLTDAMDALHKKGYTIKHIPAYGGITIGGAIALGAHGSSLKHATSLSEYLVGITFIDGKGNLVKMDITNPDFDIFRVNLGLLGIIVDATFNIVPQFKMYTKIYRTNHNLLTKDTNKLIKMIRNYDFFGFLWYPRNKKMAIIKGKYISTSYKGDAYINALSDISPFGGQVAKIGYEIVQSINSTFIMSQIQRASLQFKGDSFKIIKSPLFTDANTNKNVNPAIGYTYRLLASRCNNSCSWKYTKLEESSFTISLNKLPQVIKDINHLFTIYPTAFPISGLGFRFSPASKGILSLSNQQDSFHIDWSYPIRDDPFNNASYGLPVMQALSQLLINKYNARPHWGKNGLVYFKHNIISESYPSSSLSQFKEAVEKYDPNGLFSNNFGNRILGIGKDKIDIPSQVKHCALQDYCICEKDNDCSNKCGKIMNYQVCV